MVVGGLLAFLGGSAFGPSVVGIAAGIFAFLALILLMHAFALGLNSLFFSGEPWAGYLIEAVLERPDEFEFGMPSPEVTTIGR